MMQIEIYNPAQNEAIQPVKWNYEQLKAQITEGLKKYENIVYSDDDMTQAKKDRADLNRLSKAISDERIAMKKRYLAPYEEFEAQAKELTGLIDSHSAEIDKQVKEYEQRQKDEKQGKITAMYDEAVGDLRELVPYERIHNPKWLNKGTSLKAIKEDIETLISKVKTNLTVIDTMGFDEAMTNRVKSVYLKNFDLSDAMAEKAKIEEENRRLQEYEERKAREEAAKLEREAAEAAEAQRRAAEAENRAAETPEPEELPFTPEEEEKPSEEPQEAQETQEQQEPQIVELNFKVRGTAAQIMSLRDFLKNNGIEYGPVKFDTEKAGKIMTGALSYAYCDNCGTDEDYCDECHRKYQNWCLSEATAEGIAEEISKECL